MQARRWAGLILVLGLSLSDSLFAKSSHSLRSDIDHVLGGGDDGDDDVDGDDGVDGDGDTQQSHQGPSRYHLTKRTER